MQQEQTSERPPGRREASKRERRQRIVEAAREIFRAKGFDAATTREIAARANVASGTLFLYARDKRDLLLMIVNDDLERLTAHAFGRISPDAPLLEQLLAVFAPRYVYWAADPKLSSDALRVTISADGGEGLGEPARFHARRHAIADEIAALIAEQQRAGRVRPNVDPKIAAWVIMSIYLAAVRLWLAEPAPNVESGIARLRALLAVALDGITTG